MLREDDTLMWVSAVQVTQKLLEKVSYNALLMTQVQAAADLDTDNAHYIMAWPWFTPLGVN